VGRVDGRGRSGRSGPYLLILFGLFDMNPLQMDRFRRAAAVLALAVAGCSTDPSEVDTLPRVAVSGTVTLDGKPLPEGRLQFLPDASSSGIITVGEIKDGKFSIDRASGPIPGKYRIMVSSRPVYKIKPGESPGGSPPKSEPEAVPSQYNGKSSALVAEVKADGPYAFEFTLDSKKP
jgi:hypothetical protein